MSESPLTASWAALLVRILNVVDMFARWNEEIVEYLYLETDGEVDKPFPSRGDILAVYLLANRLYRGSPQGWYIVTGMQYKHGDLKVNPHFWAYCQFHADIAPVPDTAVHWSGQVDVSQLRDRIASKRVWVRLCSTELSGCSYYNLSDWIKTKRSLYDSSSASRGLVKSNKQRPSRIGGKPRKLSESPCEKLRVRRKARRHRRTDEYVLCTSESSSGSEDVCESAYTSVGSSFGMTTGKMTSFSTLSAESSLTPTITVRAPKPVHKPAREYTGTMSMPRYLAESNWVPLRKETEEKLREILHLKFSHLHDTLPEWVCALVQRIETECVFEKCKRNIDRYEGLCRAVSAILKQFESLIDSLEMLLPVSEELRMQISQHSASAIEWVDDNRELDPGMITSYM